MAVAKRCDTFEHTADVGLIARADTREELYEALGEGLAELVCPRESVRASETFEIEIESDDEELLAVDFLARVLTFAQTERVCFRDVRVRCDGPAKLAATLTGEPFDPARHPLGAEIKAVTYHMLEVARRDRRWIGRVLLDL